MKIYNPTGFSSSLTGSFSGSVKGTLTATGNIIPAIDQAYDLGTGTQRFRDIYLSSASIYLGNTVITEDNVVTTASLASTLPSGVISSSNQLAGETIDGDLTITGKVTAQEFHTEFVSASIIYQSGSTKFGDSADDTHSFIGNVGIGTSTPSASLHIQSTGYDTGTTSFNLTHTEETRYKGFLRLKTPAGAPIFSVGTIHDSTVYDTLFLRSGNVGIGTDNPAYKFQISGSSILSINPAAGGIDLHSTANFAPHYQTTFDWFTGNIGSGTFRMRLDANGNLQVGSSGLTDSADPRLSILSKSNYYRDAGNGLGDVHFGDGTNGISFGVATGGGGAGDSRIWATGGTKKLIIGGGADAIYINNIGNIGIGLYSPSYKLDVVGFSRFNNGFFLQEATSGTNAAIYLDDSQRLRVQSFGVSGAVRFDVGSSLTEAVIIGSDAQTTFNNNIRFGTGDGVDWKIVGNANGPLIKLRRNSATSDRYGVLGWRDNGAGEYDAIKWQDQTVTMPGSLGIGVTSPGAKLHVSAPYPTYTDFGTVFYGGTTNNSSQNGIMLSSAGNALGGVLGSNLFIDGTTWSQTNTGRSTGWLQMTNTTVAGQTSTLLYRGYVKGSTTTVERFSINGDGNVGIGTTSASVPLQIGTSVISPTGGTPSILASNGVSVPAGSRIALDTGYYTHGYLQYSGWSTEAQMGMYGYYGITLATRSGTGLVVRGDTNRVGVKTTAPAADLEVNGSIRVTGDVYSEHFINLTGNYTAGTYYDLFTVALGIPAGIYIIRIYLDTYGAGGGVYFMNFVTVPFWWENTGSNNSNWCDLPEIIGTGHALNGPQSTLPKFRLLQTPSAGGGTKMQMDPGRTWSGLDGTSGKTVHLYFKKLGT